jgi:hypothetical protein
MKKPLIIIILLLFSIQMSLSRVDGIQNIKTFDTNSTMLFDEQLSLTFTENSSTLSVNVTAPAQSDGYGVAYLLNGLSDKGYWYQVGVSWQWFGFQGFAAIFDVWDPNGSTVSAFQGGAALIGLNSNDFDTFELSIRFLNDSVIMSVVDLNTSSQASLKERTFGANTFIGDTLSPLYHGYFSGLMTEMYHNKPYYGSEVPAYYTMDFSNQKVWLWMDEFDYTNSSLLFFKSTKMPVTPNYSMSFNGGFESVGAHLFSTGVTTFVNVSALFKLIGSSSRNPALILRYFSYTWNISIPNRLTVPRGTFWSAPTCLMNSNSTRIILKGNSTGVFLNSERLNLSYFEQYSVTLNIKSIGRGTIIPIIYFSSFGENASQPFTGSLQIWADSHTYIKFSKVTNSSLIEWIAYPNYYYVVRPVNITIVYIEEFFVSTVANPPIGGQVQPKSGFYPINTTIELSAHQNKGWVFSAWSGNGSVSYTGSNPQANVVVQSPLSEEALFKPTVSICTSKGISVVYNISIATNNTITPGKCVVILLNGKITLQAKPDFPFYTFLGWNGSINSTNSVITLFVTQPLFLQVKAGLNLLLMTIIILCILIALFLALKHRH